MKYVKILGFAAFAAMALMALGAGTASATKLCKTTTDPCTEPYAKGTIITSSLTTGNSAVLEVNNSEGVPIVEDTCTESGVSGPVENAGSATETVGGKVETLTFNKCSSKTVVIKNGSLEIHSNGAGTTTGTLTSKEAEVTVELAGFGLSCIAKTGSGTPIGTLDEPSSSTTDARMTVNANITLSGFLCPVTSKWTAEYTVTSPTPLYVSNS